MTTIERTKKNFTESQTLICAFTGLTVDQHRQHLWELAEAHADKYNTDLQNSALRGWFMSQWYKFEQNFIQSIKYDARGHFYLFRGNKYGSISYYSQQTIKKMYLAEIQSALLAMAPPLLVTGYGKRMH